MKNGVKIWLFISLGCIVLGIILTALALILTGGKFNLYWSNGRWNTYETSEQFQTSASLDAFQTIDITASYDSVQLIPSDSYKIEVSYPSAYPTTWNVENGVLHVKSESVWTVLNLNLGVDNELWNSSLSYITIYYPQNTHFSNVSIVSQSGDITAQDFSSDGLTISSNSGDLTCLNLQTNTATLSNFSGVTSLQNFTSDVVTATSFSGEIELLNSNFNNSMTVNNLSGAITLDDVTSNSAEITGNSGRIEGTLISFDDVNLSTFSGKIDVSGNINQKCIASSSSGKITLTLDGVQEDYKLDLSSGSGKINVNGQSYSSNLNQSETKEKEISCSTFSGTINVNFS